MVENFSENTRLISHDEIKTVTNIPALWQEVFGEHNKVNRIQKMLSIWEQYVGVNLPNTISYLREYLEDIEIMENNGVFSLLYSIKNSNNEVLYYEGRNPQDDFDNEDLELEWGKIPESIRNFYENVHNGFYDFTSESMGLVPLESVTYLGDDDLEWGIIDDLKEPIQINLDSSFGFFSNGMGSYVAVDYTNCDNDNGTFWSAKSQPKYNINFWKYVDEWIVIGCEA